jgi:pimeloyl-ACP methyl ester carboxylesterase
VSEASQQDDLTTRQVHESREQSDVQTLLIHGSGASSAVWTDLPDRLPAALAVDLPGHPDGEPLANVDGYAAWLREHHGGGDAGDRVLVGHSLGGAIVLAYALAWPEDLAGVVLVGSGARLRVHPALLAGLADPTRADATLSEFLSRMHQRLEPGLGDFLADECRAIGAGTLLSDLRACDAFDAMDRLGSLQVPLLAVCGEDDEMTPPKYSRFLADSVPEGDALVIPGTTHLLPAERPDLLAHAIGEFLQGLAAP